MFRGESQHHAPSRRFRPDVPPPSPPNDRSRPPRCSACSSWAPRGRHRRQRGPAGRRGAEPARAAQRELRPAHLLADRAGLRTRAHLATRWSAAGASTRGSPSMPGMPYLAASAGPAGTPRQDRPAPQDHLVRPLAAGQRHHRAGPEVHRAHHRRRPGRARPDRDLPHGAVGGGGLHSAAHPGRAGSRTRTGSTASSPVWATPTWRSSCSPTAPFALCAPGDSKLPSKLIKYGVRKLSALPNTSVYIDGGAADWQPRGPEEGVGDPDPDGHPLRPGLRAEQHALRLHRTAGAVLGSHLEGAGRARECPDKYRRHQHLVERPAVQGLPDRRPGLRPRRACTSVNDKLLRHPRHPADRRRRRPEVGPEPRTTDGWPRRYVDAYLWFGRPWLYNQRAPSCSTGPLPLARTTPY